MPRFLYKARDQSGHLLTAQMEVISEKVVRDILREKNLLPLSVQEVDQGVGEQLSHFFHRVKTKDLVVFSRQLAVLVSATVPIVRALRILAQQTESKGLSAVIADVADSVDGGARLSAALHHHHRIFDDFFVYMIRSGETTGRLDEVLTYLADQKEKDYQLLSKIISSMIYPAFIVVVLVGMFIFMMIYVIPKLLDVVVTTGAELPLPTKILVTTSSIFHNYWWLILIGAVIFGFVLSFGKRVAFMKNIFDTLKLHLPVFGNIFKKIYLTRIARSLSNLLASGVPINRSVAIVADLVGNNVYRKILMDAHDQVEAGKPLSSALLKYKPIPPMVAQMMDIGEETGRLDQILKKISDFYADEVTALTEALTSLIEPLIIILLGAAALILVSGVLMPIYSITSQF
ncbi:MAG: hypothetical protein A2233_02080 [Candidatus Kerfeldbacteria bacterium RIFOXYA2_FULL_38_24]|uniref:Type II secretion system protein GspF domain-containing protein n=1 Tax=Candidatus Kerfeldbacteria bacterium RIFOXYB2_FULL_38_14 TaxID=1798547 RepID=A0A1G2BEP1_9BACT|nr:MAG: hypothetical protein A2319_04680 [Candidatus Kerfeldbacteria bacterium RIFOXYB2_FULL_38_14]OGY87903.1 MAG: hypothetical protein A2233_02080 [Candidatus Kerfeldbacteria bacterium RIFOXYA2_FULL_38_24]OGY88682.1 MAG: hypothetical protein A2458_03525 [Candidatus Kerfeldbacteria bacterium RIFOXYC2_FULL_38_9]